MHLHPASPFPTACISHLGSVHGKVTNGNRTLNWREVPPPSLLPLTMKRWKAVRKLGFKDKIHQKKQQGSWSKSSAIRSCGKKVAIGSMYIRCKTGPFVFVQNVPHIDLFCYYNCICFPRSVELIEKGWWCFSPLNCVRLRCAVDLLIRPVFSASGIWSKCWLKINVSFCPLWSNDAE